MAEEILDAYADRIAEVALVPSSGGRFVVRARGTEIFNKAKAGQFPAKGELRTRLAAHTQA